MAARWALELRTVGGASHPPAAGRDFQVRYYFHSLNRHGDGSSCLCTRRRTRFVVRGRLRRSTARRLRLPPAAGATGHLPSSVQLETPSAGERHVVSRLVHGHVPTAPHRVGDHRAGAGGPSLWRRGDYHSYCFDLLVCGFCLSQKPGRFTRRDATMSNIPLQAKVLHLKFHSVFLGTKYQKVKVLRTDVTLVIC